MERSVPRGVLMSERRDQKGSPNILVPACRYRAPSYADIIRGAALNDNSGDTLAIATLRRMGEHSACLSKSLHMGHYFGGAFEMHVSARLVAASEVLPLRTKFREEMNNQIMHDSLHERKGWTQSYLLEFDGIAAGFGGVAIGGPWKDKPTVFEFYVPPHCRSRLFDLFEALLAASGARFFEVQTNEPCLPIMLHVHGRDIASESIVFADQFTTALPANGALFRCTTSDAEARQCIEERAGGPEAVLEIDGKEVAKGGILFHYNRPYGDIHMEIAEPFRRRGMGSYLVQELKRLTYELGAVPAARCNTDNVASRRTLQRAGFVPCAHILVGSIPQ